MRRAQIFFWILWVSAAAVMVLIGGRVAYQVFYILSLILILGIVYMLSVYFLVTISVKTDALHGVTGGQIPMIISLKSMFILPVPAMVLTFAKNPQVGCIKEYAVTLYPYTQRHLRMKLDFKCRGVYKVGVSNWRAGDYFGIFSTGRRANAYCLVSVLPRVLTVSERPPLPQQEVDANIESISGELSGARPYTGTDSMRNIHWKLSAKSEELYTKQFSGTMRPPTWVIIDLSITVGEEAAVLEDKLLETALSLVNFLLDASPVMCAAVSDGEFSVTKLTHAGEFDEYYRTLGLVEFDGIDFCERLKDFDMEDSGSVWLVTSDDNILPTISGFVSYDWDVKWVNVTEYPDEQKHDRAREHGALVQHISLSDDVSVCAWMADEVM